MTKIEYEAKIAELEKQLNALKNTDIEEEKLIPLHPRWKPEVDEFYYYLNAGIVASTSWDGNELDQMSLNAGFVYMSRTAAEFALERMKVLTEMREWAGTNKDEAFIYYDYNSDNIMIDWDGHGYYHGDIRFHSIDDAENCVKAVGADRIKRYYFMAPEKEQSDDSAGI